MRVEELADDSVLIEPALNLGLNGSVLHLFVLLNDLLDLVDDSFEGPLCEVSGHLHARQLAVELNFLDILEKVGQLNQGGAALAKTIKHFLREVAIHTVLLKISYFLYISRDLIKEARNESRHVLLLEVALQNLQRGAGVAFWYRHGLQKACY